MARNQDLRLKIGLVLLAVGCVLFFNPFWHEPMWAEWLLGPVLMYVGLPLAMVGAAIHFFRASPTAPAQNSLPKPRA